MFIQVIVAVTLAAISVATPADLHGHSGVDEYYSDPQPYHFGYGVHDDYSGTDFGQTETSDGQTVKGSYSVQLPDGRKQTVKYIADHYGGYRAEVSYQGEAKHPDHVGPAVTFGPEYHDVPTLYHA